MRLSIDLYGTSLALVLASTTFACNSGTGASPGDDSGAPPQSQDAGPGQTTPGDSSVSTPTPDSSVSTPTPDASVSSDDSSTPSTPDSSSPTSDAAPPEDAGPAALSFNTDIYVPIIEKHCTGCHGFGADGGAGSGISFGKLDMSSVDAGYANLVNAAAAGAACATTTADGGGTLLRVVPGSADTSLLYEKVNGFTVAPPCGGAMPKSGEIPDGGQAIIVEQIETWIDQGALP